MSDSGYKFKDLNGLLKKFGDVRYRTDDHGNVSIPDEAVDLWVQVVPGDKVIPYEGGGYTVEQGEGLRQVNAYRPGGPNAAVQTELQDK